MAVCKVAAFVASCLGSFTMPCINHNQAPASQCPGCTFDSCPQEDTVMEGTAAVVLVSHSIVDHTTTCQCNINASTALLPFVTSMRATSSAQHSSRRTRWWHVCYHSMRSTSKVLESSNSLCLSAAPTFSTWRSLSSASLL